MAQETSVKSSLNSAIVGTYYKDPLPRLDYTTLDSICNLLVEYLKIEEATLKNIQRGSVEDIVKVKNDISDSLETFGIKNDPESYLNKLNQSVGGRFIDSSKRHEKILELASSIYHQAFCVSVKDWHQVITIPSLIKQLMSVDKFFLNAKRPAWHEVDYLNEVSLGRMTKEDAQDKYKGACEEGKKADTLRLKKAEEEIATKIQPLCKGFLARMELEELTISKQEMPTDISHEPTTLGDDGGANYVQGDEH